MTAIEELGVALPSAADLAELMGLVWSSFLGEDLQVTALHEGSEVRKIESHDRVISSVSIAGPWSGHLTISVSQPGAKDVAAVMFEMPLEEITSDEMVDAFGEIANIAGGNVKAMLPEPSTLTLPQVVVGSELISLFSARLCGTAEMIWRDYTLEVSLWETSAVKDNGSS